MPFDKGVRLLGVALSSLIREGMPDDTPTQFSLPL